jgi:CTP-dependent riboflavin kinase
MNPEPIVSEWNERKSVSGTVVTGSKRAAFFTQLDWVKRQCLTLLGFEPFPGTLNIRLTAQDGQMMAEIRKRPGVPLIPPDGAFCQSLAYPLRIGTIPGALIIPEEGVCLHGSEIVEILAPVGLRETLNVQDGDRISFTLLESPVLETQ